MTKGMFAGFLTAMGTVIVGQAAVQQFAAEPPPPAPRVVDSEFFDAAVLDCEIHLYRVAGRTIRVVYRCSDGGAKLVTDIIDLCGAKCVADEFDGAPYQGSRLLTIHHPGALPLVIPTPSLDAGSYLRLTVAFKPRLTNDPLLRLEETP